MKSLNLFSTLLVLAVSCGKSGIQKGGSPTPETPKQNDNSTHDQNKTEVDEKSKDGNSAAARLKLEDLLFDLPAAGHPSLISVDNAPDGSYGISEISSIQRPNGTDAVLAIRHKVALPGTVSSANDSVESVTKWETLDFTSKKYPFAIEIQLPSELKVQNGSVSFTDEHYYWQRRNNDESKALFMWSDFLINSNSKSTTSDIDLLESFRTKASLQNGYYVNNSQLSFTALGFVGTPGSIAAMQKNSNGDLTVYIKYELNPTSAGYEKTNKLVRLIYKKK